MLDGNDDQSEHDADDAGRASDDTVGFGKPPKSTRFTKGKSGNPQGRPKGARNLKTDVLEELNEKVRVTEGGRVRKITKQRGMVKQLAAKALAGDPKAAATLMSYGQRFDDKAADPDADKLTQDDVAIIDGFRESLRIILEAELAAAGRPGEKP